MYELTYLPLALKDLHGAIDYITNVLKAPKSAIDLLDDLEAAIFRLQDFPFSCKIYQIEEQLDTEYRILIVKNYLVFYVAKDHTIEIHRIINGRIDLKKNLEKK